jgi:hypothetical protein
MATTNDVLHANRTDRAAWVYDQDNLPPMEVPAAVNPKSSAARHAAAVREGEQAHAKERDEILTKLQAKRKRQRAERARTRGLSTAQILAGQREGA